MDFLLRADTVFTSFASATLDDPDRPLHYPDFVSGRDKYNYDQPSRKMVTFPYFRHEEAEKITKVILESIGLKDSTYHGLKVRGSVFVCERCEDSRLKTWDDIVSRFVYFVTRFVQRVITSLEFLA